MQIVAINRFDEKVCKRSYASSVGLAASKSEEARTKTLRELNINCEWVPFGTAQFSHLSGLFKSSAGRADVPPGTSLRKV
jgi:hypothetical protein